MGRNEHAGEGALSDTTATNDNNLVLGHEVKRCVETKCTNRQRRRGILRGKPATPKFRLNTACGKLRNRSE
jgi:hypothetical protein